MIQVISEKFPVVALHEHGRRWLPFTAKIGRAPNTVLAYGWALEDHLRFCALVGADPLTLGADLVAAWIGDLLERPNPRAPRLEHVGSGAGLANATIQQRVVAVRSFYEFLVEDGARISTSNHLRTIQVLIDREAILTGAAGGEPWKYYDLGDGYCSYDFFAKCPQPPRLRPLSLLRPQGLHQGPAPRRDTQRAGDHPGPRCPRSASWD